MQNIPGVSLLHGRMLRWEANGHRLQCPKETEWVQGWVHHSCGATIRKGVHATHSSFAEQLDSAVRGADKHRHALANAEQGNTSSILFTQTHTHHDIPSSLLHTHTSSIHTNHPYTLPIHTH